MAKFCPRSIVIELLPIRKKIESAKSAISLLIQRSNLGMHQSLMLVSGFESGEILITFITLSFNVI
jgi:hypothetical protein